MGPEIILFIAAVITKMLFTHREEMQYARKGKDSPRYRMKMAKFKAEQQQGNTQAKAPTRPGAKGYFGELWHDLWEDLDAHRKRVRQERKDGTRPTRREKARELAGWARRTLNRRRDGRPVDDMLDVIADAKPAANPAKGPQPTTGPAAGSRPDPADILNAVARGTDPARTSSQPLDVVGVPDDLVAEAREALAEADPDGRRNALAVAAARDALQKANPRVRPELIDQALDEVDADKSLPPNNGQQRPASPSGATQPADPTSTTATDDRPDATVIQFPTTWESDMSISSEVTGLVTTIAFCRASADAHASYSTGGGETFMGAVQAQGYGPGIQTLVAEAQASSATAAAKWEAAAEAMEEFQKGREFYQDNPDAPERAALVNE